jgi:hypothetical protein
MRVCFLILTTFLFSQSLFANSLLVNRLLEQSRESQALSQMSPEEMLQAARNCDDYLFLQNRWQMRPHRVEIDGHLIQPEEIQAALDEIIFEQNCQ